MMPPVFPDRLGFTLPDFTRVAWVSDEAKRVWSPRIERIGLAWSQIEWRSITARLRRRALLRMTPTQFVKLAREISSFGLAALPLEIEGAHEYAYASVPHPVEAGKDILFCNVVGTIEDVSEFADAWTSRDHERIGEMLGYPECCTAFFKKVWVEDGCIDTTWQMAIKGKEFSRCTLEVNGSPLSNIMWRWLGVRAVPHLPCCFHCEETIRLGAGMIQVGEEIGFSEEMSWLKEILSWPSEWSALHGIAEVKTPILKVSTRTDATARKYIVRRTSTQYPAEAATGLGFPYRSSEQTMLTDSRSFHHGIENIIRFREPVPNWRHLDNGFTSFHMMEQLHKPIVDLARDVIGEAGGTVMDFGCGNGSLLEKICRGRQEIIPFGIDRNTLALQHAALLLPEYRANFIGADLFDVNAWSSPRRYALGIFMAGRLIENPGAHTLHFLSAVRDSCEHLLVYVYPGWSEDSLIEIVRKAGLRILRHSNGGMVALVSVP